MCGINGIFSYKDSAPRISETELLLTREHMRNRGPDGEGAWTSPDRRVGLAHRRLAIIDLTDSGAQPMATEDGRLRITFNGEIYNYRALRTELERKGYVFRSQSDTEVLLHLYADRGLDMVHALRGMFAFAIWDEREKTLTLARDPFGIKPLYYSDNGSTLRFASQVKALVAGGAISRAPEPAGATGFLIWGCVPEPFTTFRDIVALPAGSALTLRRDDKPALRSYFSIREELVRARAKARPFRIGDREALGEFLRDSVRHHLIADVPVGAFLSSGIDSTLVASLAAAEIKGALRTFTLGFDEYLGSASDEVPLAERTAAALGVRHETHRIARSVFEREYASILDSMDQPSTDGVNTWLVCRQAASAGLKVALSGLGGDELFGGYPSFRDVPRMAELIPARPWARSLGIAVRALLAPMVRRFTSPKFAGLLEYGGTYAGAFLLRRALYMPWELRELVDPVALHVGLERLRTLPAISETIDSVETPHARVAALEFTWYMKNQLLRDADWASMAHSIEIRAPFVDAALFREVAPWLASGQAPSKIDAATGVGQPIFRDILDRPKSGFSVPVREWLVSETKVPSAVPARGLRGWARTLMPAMPKQFRILVLLTDAYGGLGGIAKFNRDLVGALAALPVCAEVVVVPRLIPAEPDSIPSRVKIVKAAVGGKLRFVWHAARSALNGPYDLVVAAHVNLAAFAAAIASLRRLRSALVVHGVDAWKPHPEISVRASLRRFTVVIGVSKLTLDRFHGWSRIDDRKLRLLPNCVDLKKFSPGTRSAELARSLGIDGRTVIMTMGRLASEERYKGFDEVLAALPELIRLIPDIVYLVCGDGADRKRLEEKAKDLCVSDRVVFAGFVPEGRKADYYRLADAYVMPSRGEGFGIVFLEAMSCGIPVVGSSADGSREALRDGELGILVDPDDPRDIVGGTLAALRARKGVPQGLDYFSEIRFNERIDAIVSELLQVAEAR